MHIFVVVRLNGCDGSNCMVVTGNRPVEFQEHGPCRIAALPCSSWEVFFSSERCIGEGNLVISQPGEQGRVSGLTHMIPPKSEGRAPGEGRGNGGWE